MFHVKLELRSRGLLMFHVEPTQGLTPKPVSDVSRETETHFFLTTDTTRVDSPSSTPRSSCTSQVAALNLRRAFKDRKSTRLNSSHVAISYAVFCLKKKKQS